MPKGPDDWEKFEAAQIRKQAEKKLAKAAAEQTRAQDEAQLEKLKAIIAAHYGVDPNEVQVHLSKRGRS